MSDDSTNNPVDKVQTEVKAEPLTDNGVAMQELQDKIASLESASAKRDLEFQAVVAKKEELLGEKKNEQIKARQAEEDKLKSKGDVNSYKELLSSAQKKLDDKQGEFDTYMNKVGNEKLYSEALKAASELSDGSNVEIMADILAKRLKYVDGAIKITDKDGGLTVSSMSDLVNEFKGQAKYKSLLRGTNANGGNASGSGNSVTPTTEMDIVKFRNLTPAIRESFVDGMRKGTHKIT